jgi:hypothetical protein
VFNNLYIYIYIHIYLKELMVEDTARRNPVSPQGSILWAEDDALARAIGRPEYSGRVRGMGLEPLPIRTTSRSSTLA